MPKDKLINLGHAEMMAETINDEITEKIQEYDEEQDAERAELLEGYAPLDHTHEKDFSVTDPNDPAYIKNKPDSDDALELVAETGLVEPMTDENGSIFTDENGAIYTLI